MAGGSNPNMVQAASNPYSQAAAAQQGALATYANPAAAASNMMNPFQQQVVDATIREKHNIKTLRITISYDFSDFVGSCF